MLCRIFVIHIGLVRIPATLYQDSTLTQYHDSSGQKQWCQSLPMAARGNEFFHQFCTITARGSDLKNYFTVLRGNTLEHVAPKSFQAAVQNTKS